MRPSDLWDQAEGAAVTRHDAPLNSPHLQSYLSTSCLPVYLPAINWNIIGESTSVRLHNSQFPIPKSNGARLNIAVCTSWNRPLPNIIYAPP